jgi:hypothetical protein
VVKLARNLLKNSLQKTPIEQSTEQATDKSLSSQLTAQSKTPVPEMFLERIFLWLLFQLLDKCILSFTRRRLPPHFEFIEDAIAHNCLPYKNAPSGKYFPNGASIIRCDLP